MQLLVAFKSDPAGYNMASHIAEGMDEKQDGFYKGKNFDLAIIPTPAISADWLEEKYSYDGFVFLSKHASESGTLALTCHSTGNFGDAQFGGSARQVAVPHPHLQKSYMKHLWEMREHFAKFEITIEATHHGPTGLSKPALFIEIGTTEKEWNNKSLCNDVAEIVAREFESEPKKSKVALCFGGTHYPEKFNRELIEGEFALGTVIPRHALDALDGELFEHILGRNREASVALVDWRGLGKNKQKIISMLENTSLEVVRL
ncbi:MAG TPA: D-aminoacyl-tRNA deacylase [Candidatus Nitrosotalea sp.]|nr:D-aminoacyl-tRNA deacylase [Candidatus Nitrosotalea sp.]